MQIVRRQCYHAVEPELSAIDPIEQLRRNWHFDATRHRECNAAIQINFTTGFEMHRRYAHHSTTDCCKPGDFPLEPRKSIRIYRSLRLEWTDRDQQSHYECSCAHHEFL